MQEIVWLNQGFSCTLIYPSPSILPIHKLILPYLEGIYGVHIHHMTTKPVPFIQYPTGKPILAYVFVESEYIQYKPITMRPTLLSYHKNLVVIFFVIPFLPLVDLYHVSPHPSHSGWLSPTVLDSRSRGPQDRALLGRKSSDFVRRRTSEFCRGG